MTPHERASAVVEELKALFGEQFAPGDEAFTLNAITTALQAQSNVDEMRHREKQQALRDLLAKTLAENDKLRDEAVTARAELYRLTDGCARCGSPGPKAEGTIWCAECLEWYREEWGYHTNCCRCSDTGNPCEFCLCVSERRALQAEIGLLTDKLIAAGNAKADLKEALMEMSGIDSGSVEAEAREKIQQIGYAETLRRVGDCGKWSLTWESVSNILELLQEGIISRRKAYESLNSILHGESLNLPPLENCAFDDVELPGETVSTLRDILAAEKQRADAAEQERDNWTKTARQHCRNEKYYRGIVIKIGNLFGSEARTSDDGTTHDDVLCAKIYDLASALAAANAKLRDALVEVRSHYPSDYVVRITEIIDAALLATHFESLEEIRRAAKIEALEEIPCEFWAMWGKVDCATALKDTPEDTRSMCDRCYALRELKGGQ